MNQTNVLRNSIKAVFATLTLAAASAQAAPVTVTTFNTNVGLAQTLTNAIVVPNSGVNVIAGTEAYQGTNNASVQQAGLYSNFNLAPKTGNSPTVALANGVLLTSGKAVIAPNNTATNTSGIINSAGAAQLTALSGETTHDASTLGFHFTVDAGVTSVSANFVFATEEFPTETVTDIFGFFIDGVNYAKFSDGKLISNAPGGQTNFISNPVNTGLYQTGFNGFTQVFTVTGLLNANLTNHTLFFGVADTTDYSWDSAVYLTGLTGGKTNSGGGISTDVPEPGSIALFGAAVAAAGVLRRRKQA